VPLVISNASPLGALKRAFVPIPFPIPAVALPAHVVTTPTGDTERMRLLPVSPTNTRPEGWCTVAALGELKKAPAPVPSAKPAEPEPPNVDTVPEEVCTERTTWLERSAT